MQARSTLNYKLSITPGKLTGVVGIWCHLGLLRCVIALNTAFSLAKSQNTQESDVSRNGKTFTEWPYLHLKPTLHDSCSTSRNTTAAKVYLSDWNRVTKRTKCTVALFTQSQWPVSCPPPHATGEGSFSWHIWRKDRQRGWNLWHDTRYYRVPAGHAPPPLGSLRKPQPVRCLTRGRLWIHQSHRVPYMPL